MPENFSYHKKRKEKKMGTIQIKRGLSTNLPQSALAGEVLYTTDTKRFYVGNGTGVALTEFANYAELLEAINELPGADHKHTASDVNDFATSVDARITSQKGSANGIATLDTNGLIPIAQIPSTFKEAQVVEDIDARDELDAFAGLHAYVLDATGDESVETGAAEYIYDGENWVKLAELSDVDAVISWDNINNKPTIATTLLALTDTPATFTNQGGKLLAVNSSENALVFTDTFSGNIDGGSF